MEETKQENQQQEEPKKEMQQNMQSGEMEKTPEPAWLFYVLAFLIPLVGLILGIIYKQKSNPETQKLAKNMLTISIIMIIIPCICWLIYVFLIGGLAVFGDASTY